MSFLLGARQFFERRGSPTPPLPYDAEVDWLEATGTQWIDTGLANAANRLIRVRFQKTGSLHVNTVMPFQTWISRSVLVAVIVQNPGSGWLFRGACVTGLQTLGPADLDWHEVKIDTTVNKKSLWFDGVKKYEVAAGVSTTPTITNKLFAYANSSTADPTLFGSGRIAAYTVTDTVTGQVIQDLIPVRKNGVGYMYDKVSGQLLGNSGTGALLYGPDKPYDYEVEYIQRDCSVAWLNASGSAVSAGIDIAEYLDGSSMMTSTRPIEARWSTDSGNVGGTLSAIVMPTNVLWAGAFLGRNAFGGGYRYNNWWEYTIGTDGAPQFDIDTFHVTKASPDGNGTWTYYFDGTQVGSSLASASTNAFNNAVLIRHSSANTYQNLRMRVSFVRLGSDAYFIPVVKGNSKGFYNLVDGHLFLAEQACLSAGATVR